MPLDSVGIEVVQDSKTNLRKKLKNHKKNGDESNLGVWGVLSSCTVVRLRQISPEKERLLNKQDKRSMEAIIICQ